MGSYTISIQILGLTPQALYLRLLRRLTDSRNRHADASQGQRRRKTTFRASQAPVVTLLEPAAQAEELERKLPRKLQNAWVKCCVDLAEIGVVDVQRIRHLEISVIEDVECFEA